MAGLLDIFGTSGADTMGLLGMSAEDIQRNRDDAQAQALYALAGRLFQGGNTGQSIAEGLQAGQKAYKGGMQDVMQTQLQNYQLQDMLRKRKEEDAKRQQEQRVRELAPQIFTTTTTPAEYDDPMGALTKAAQTTRTIDPNKLQALAMLSNDPIASLSQMAKLVPDLRKAGFLGGGGQEDNPFLQFTTDSTIPKHLQTLAAQYATSFKNGLIDPEKADQRYKEISDAVGRYQQFTQSQDTIKAAQAQTQAFQTAMTDLKEKGMKDSAEYKQLQAQNTAAMIELRKATEANKPEQFSYAQKKEFDILNKYKAEASKSDDMASAAMRASPLLDQAYGTRFEAGVKGVGAAVGFGSDAKDANDKLKTIAQTLVLNAPKLGGSTSNADAERYDKAAGSLDNPSTSLEAKKAALKDIIYLSEKQKAYAEQAENYFYENNKSMRGFKFIPPPDPSKNPYAR
jgi:hypothetical protein